MSKYVASVVNPPMKTEMKKGIMGTPTIGDAIFRNQFGVTGNSLSDSKKKIILLLLSSNYKKQY